MCVSLAKKLDYDSWEKFLKYDLCITNYNALSDEEKQLCHFIFDTEQAANGNVVCERARRILAGDDVGERITLEQLENAYGLWDNYSDYKCHGWQLYIDCVPDIVHLKYYEYPYEDFGCICPSEYWLDDDCNNYVVFLERVSDECADRFDIYDRNGERIKVIQSVFDCPMKDFRGIPEYMEKFGFIEKNGGYYYTKSDGTAVFAWSNYSSGQCKEKITEPFIVESEINGCLVTAIEYEAFAQAPFTEIILPDTIEIIDRYAFRNCQYLETINFPKSLKYIGREAFADCDSIAKIQLDCPDLVLEKLVFTECHKLKTAYINVNDIGEEAFSFCENLENVTLGENVKSIGYQAFLKDTLIADINIPSSLRIIEQGALVNINSIKIPPNVQIIGSLPCKTQQKFTSGIELNQPQYPLCSFNTNCTIYGYEGTEAESYANEWGLEFVPLEYIKGDANFDNNFNISDVVTMQNWLLNRSDTELVYWKAANLCDDDVLDVFDLIAMKKLLINW